MTDERFEPQVMQAEAELRARGDGGGMTSYIQRKLLCGYNRAALIIETLETRGIVTASDETGKRKLIQSPPLSAEER